MNIKKGRFRFLTNWFLLVWLSIFIPSKVIGNLNTHVINHKTINISFTKHTYYFYDSAQTLNPKQSIVLPNQELFKPYKKNQISEGINNGIHWVYLDVVNQLKPQTKVMVEFNNNEIDFIKGYLFEENANTYQLIHTTKTIGDYFNFEERIVNSNDFVLPFTLPQNKTYRILIGIQKNDRYISTGINLWEENAWINKNRKSQTFFGFWLGALVFYLIVGLFLAVFLKDKVYWYYLFYVATAMLYMLIKESFLYEFLYNHNPQFNDLNASRVSTLSLIFFLLFTRRFLNIKSYSNILFKTSNIILTLFALLLVLNIAESFISLKNHALLLTSIFFGSHLLLIIWLLGAGLWVFARTKSRKSLVYLGAFSILLFTITSSGLGFFSSFVLVTVRFGLMVGLMVEVTLLSLFMMLELKFIQDEKIRVQKELINERKSNIKTLLNSIERERNRIGRDLHDSAGSKIAIIKNLLNEPQANNHKQQVFTEINELGNELKTLSHQMLPIALKEIGLTASVKSLVSKLANHSKIKIELVVENFPNKLPEEIALNLYRIIQEALTNAMKYAKATQITIQLLRYDNELLIQIEDDGIGFENPNKLEGKGLENMKIRAEAIGAKLDIDSTPYEGTIISLSLEITNAN